VNIEEARLYLEHTSKEDFNLEEHQKENRYQAIQVVLKEIERLNNIISKVKEYSTSYESISIIQGLDRIEQNEKLDKHTMNEMVRRYMEVHDKLLKMLEGSDKE